MEDWTSREDRWWLWGVVLGTVLFIGFTLTVHWMRQRRADPTAWSAPQQVLWDYIQAMLHGDYPQAYTLLAVERRPPTLAAFEEVASSITLYLSEVSVELGSVEPVSEDRVRVQVTFVSTSSGFDPFDLGVYTFSDWAVLRKEEGQWRIERLPGPLSLPWPEKPLPPMEGKP